MIGFTDDADLERAREPGRARGRGRASRDVLRVTGPLAALRTWWRCWSARATGWSRWMAGGSWRRSS